MYCPSCGTQDLQRDRPFCRVCGGDLRVVRAFVNVPERWYVLLFKQWQGFYDGKTVTKPGSLVVATILLEVCSLLIFLGGLTAAVISQGSLAIAYYLMILGAALFGLAWFMAQRTKNILRNIENAEKDSVDTKSPSSRSEAKVIPPASVTENTTNLLRP